jgi:signal peptidase I
MFSFFQPRYVKEGQIILKNAHKLLHYKRDLLSESSVADFTALTDNLQQALHEHDEKAAKEIIQKLEAQWSLHLPPAKEAWWRENCEVFLVAIIIAIGVRTYFIQPFTIPTGSMQPTLYGIIGTKTDEPAPNLLVRLLHAGLYGRSYVDVVAEADEAVRELVEHKWLFFFAVTDIYCTNHTYRAPVPKEALMRYFHVDFTRQYQKGEVIARGYVNTGDHVFVDKFTYHFCPPNRGDVFVFSTKDIRGLEAHHNPAEGSQFYIKRLAGLPGDTLRIDPPQLFVNGALPTRLGFQRVMSRQDGYDGYHSGPSNGLLNAPDNELHVPPKSYVALGDNSGNSLDSRYWGFVPERNIMGRALFVYWPFAGHWGLIR